MTTSDKFLYYGIWGLAVGFALFYGWRFSMPLLAPLASYAFSIFATDTDFDPILAGTVLNLGLDFVAGFCVSVALAILIRFALKPTTMLFVVVPVAVLLAKSYWWLLGSYLDNSFIPSTAQLVMYVVGPLLVALLFVAAFRAIALKSLTSGSSRPTKADAFVAG